MFWSLGISDLLKKIGPYLFGKNLINAYIERGSNYYKGCQPGKTCIEGKSYPHDSHVPQDPQKATHLLADIL